MRRIRCNHVTDEPMTHFSRMPSLRVDCAFFAGLIVLWTMIKSKLVSISKSIITMQKCNSTFRINKICLIMQTWYSERTKRFALPILSWNPPVHFSAFGFISNWKRIHWLLLQRYFLTVEIEITYFYWVFSFPLN